MVTIEMIAETAGVSKMTVSRALRGLKGISEQKRAQVMDIADSLGYRPNPLISAHMASLRSQRTLSETVNIAFLTDFEIGLRTKAPDYILQFYRSAEAQAKKHGFTLHAICRGGGNGSSTVLSRILNARGVEGVLLAGLQGVHLDLDIDWAKVAVVRIGHAPAMRHAFHQIASHKIHGIRLALDHLTQCGHERIGLCLTPTTNARTDQAYASGFFGHRFSSGSVGWERAVHINDSSESDRYFEWLRGGDYSAVLLHGPELIEMHRTTCNANNLRIMEFDLSGLCVSKDAPGLVHDFKRIAETATDMLISEILLNNRGIPDSPKTVLVEDHIQ